MTAADYNRCVDLYADSVYRFVLKSVRDVEQAKDIVQDTFEKVWVKAPDLDMERVKSYIFTTAYHTLIDSIRKHKPTADIEGLEENQPHINNGYSDLKQVLQLALAKLPAIQRSVVLLRDYEGYSYEEIGEITSLTESQVKVYIYRARLFLKSFIGKVDHLV
ncbi:MAG: RNA polymerase sigma factor [Bacteroidia bacterium]|jgi:RNA polymerase sigma-70 factor (ECF subfamily)|nr:RNA polymerase sigma factor [Bacteroidia bacterium]